VVHHGGASSKQVVKIINEHAMKGLIYYYGKHFGKSRLCALRSIMAFSGLMRETLGLVQYCLYFGKRGKENLEYGRKLLKISAVSYARLMKSGT
jgi:hypothetical protein